MDGQRVTPATDPARAWVNSWLLAFRVGAREIRRARGRSALIMTMVGMPVLLIVAIATWSMSTSSRGIAPEVFGNGQAVIQPDGDRGARVAGHEPGEPWTAAQVGSLINGTVVPIASGDLGLQLSSRIHAAAIELPVRDLPATGLLKLRSGQWPTSEDQILITRDFAARHRLGVGAEIPAFRTQQAGGQASVRLRVVGIAALPDDSDLHGDVVLGRQQLITISRPSQQEFLIIRQDRVTADDVRRLDPYGLEVISRYLVQHPELAPDQADELGYGDVGTSSDLAFYVLLGAGLLFESMLLAGPAFAIAAARQRHTMGLIASNGAMRDQLRRQLLGQALILGVLAGALGAVLGSLAARYGVIIAARVHGTWAPPAPILVRAATVAFLGAAIAAVVAALWPARGLGRLDLVEVLRHRSISTRTSTFGPIIGMIMLVGGLVAALGFGFRAAAEMQPRYLMGLGTAVAFVGAMLLLPWLVTALARAAARFPLAIRLAGRDAARHLGRNVPAMAAVLAASGMFTIMAIAVASDDRVQEQQYRPSTTLGQGIIYAASDADATIEVIRGLHPDWRLTPQAVLGRADTDGGVPGAVTALVPGGCTPGQAVDAFDADTPAEFRCAEASSDNGIIVRVVPPDATGAAGLPPTAQEALANGRVVLAERPIGADQSGVDIPVRKDLISDGHVTVVVGTRKGKSYVAGRPVPLPATVIAEDQLRPEPATDEGTIGWVSEQTARRSGLPTTVISWNVVAPQGAITADQEKSLNELAPPDAPLDVERGYQSAMKTVGLGLLGVGAILVIIAALIATALSQVEARPDLATLTAVGAPPGLRRRVAAAQAVIIILVGVVAGQIVGLTAGIAFAASNTREYSGGGGPGTPAGPPVIAVPWEQPVILLLAAAVIAAGLAVLGAWSSPRLTRRLG